MASVAPGIFLLFGQNEVSVPKFGREQVRAKKTTDLIPSQNGKSHRENIRLLPRDSERPAGETFAENLCLGPISLMKKHKNLFDKICSLKNLHSAYLKARKCKRYRSNTLEFSYRLEDNLLKIQQELQGQTYCHGNYREFVVRDLKKRRIKAPPFSDRVIHHALCNVINGLFDRGFIFDSYACRKKKGTHKAIKRLERFLKLSAKPCGEGVTSPKIFCLKCDVSKYFENINHEVLLRMIKKKIADKKALWLIKKILDSSEEKPGTGIPIGNLTSQLFANIYLNKLDQFAKHKLRAKYYIRYMDDFLVLGFDKKELHRVKEGIREFLRNKLNLELHPKKANIFPVEKGVDFLGYQIFGTHRLLRKSTVRRFVKRIKTRRKPQSLQSWAAYARFGNSWRLRKKLSKRLLVDLIKCK